MQRKACLLRLTRKPTLFYEPLKSNAMKNITKILITCVGIFCLSIMYSCEGQPHEPQIYYIYYNNSSNDIKITAYGTASYPTTKEEIETVYIPKGQSITVRYNGDDPEDPFYGKIYKNSYLLITNGKITMKIKYPDSLYDIDNYINTKEVKYHSSTYKHEYTFTDNFFKNGTPIEE